jgi:DNA-directed RNA polymerase subunit RPC12/RpoP
MDSSKCTDEEFDKYLRQIVSEMSAEQILSYGEVYSFFSEVFNNEVLDAWAADHPEISGLPVEYIHWECPHCKTYNKHPESETGENGVRCLECGLFVDYKDMEFIDKTEE